MSGPAFEWDSGKAIANLKDHGVSFEEAMTVFRKSSPIPVCFIAA